MNYSLPGSFVLGISQVRILEWVAVAISFSRGSSQPRDRTPVAGGFFTTEPLRKPYSLMMVTVGLNSATRDCSQKTAFLNQQS